MSWHNDTTPPPGDRVLVWGISNLILSDPFYEVAFFRDGQWLTANDQCVRLAVSHWMALPSPTDERWQPFNPAPPRGDYLAILTAIALPQPIEFKAPHVDLCYVDVYGAVHALWIEGCEITVKASHWMFVPKVPTFESLKSI